MRILFIYSEIEPFKAKPTAVPLLSAILKQHGHALSFLDTSQYDQSEYFTQSKEHLTTKPYFLKRPRKTYLKLNRNPTSVTQELRFHLNEFNPEVILVSATTIAFFHFLRILSKIETAVPVIYGGYHVIGNSESAIRHPQVNAICIGEAEEVLPELLAKIENGQYYFDTLNFFFKKENGEIIRNLRLPLKDNLDELPFLDYSIFDPHYHFYRLYNGRYYRMADIVHLRGCYNACSFCFYDQYYKLFNQERHTIRAYSPKRAIDELEYLVKNYNLNFVRFHASDFLAPEEDYISQFSLLYRKKIGLPNIINSTVRSVTKNKARLLRWMDCRSVTLGIESGNEQYRKRVLNKHFTNSEFIQKVAYLHSEGIRVTSNNMIFLPEETRDMIFENIRLHKNAKIQVLDYKTFVPFPGLSITKYCQEKNLLKDNVLTFEAIKGRSILRSPISEKEQDGLIKTLYLYKEFPKILWKFISIAERDTFFGKITHKILHEIYHISKYAIGLDEIWLRVQRHFKNLLDYCRGDQKTIPLN